MSEEITQVPDDAHIIGARAQARDESCTIDHRLVKRLIKAGINEAAAEILAENQALQGAATAQQLAEVEANLSEKMKQMEINSNERMAQIEANSNERMNQMENNSNEKMRQMEINLQKDMKQIEANLRTEMAQMETRLTNRIVGGFIAIASLMVSLFVIFLR